MAGRVLRPALLYLGGVVDLPRDESEFEEYIAWMLEVGALVEKTVDGELAYGLTDLTPILAPEYYEAWMTDIDESLLELYALGLINIEYNENLEATFSLTEEGRLTVEAMLDERNNPDNQA
jgi:predicted transcriptional regulator